MGGPATLHGVQGRFPLQVPTLKTDLPHLPLGPATFPSETCYAPDGYLLRATLCDLDFVFRRKMVNFAMLCTIVYSTMKGSIKEIYDAPAVEVVEVQVEGVICDSRKGYGDENGI